MIEAGYPTGSSADAMYYDTNSSKTGWYAIGAFLALIVLVIGGVLLFQALSDENGEGEPTQFILADYTNPPQLLADVTADLDSLGIRYEVFPEENAVVPVGFVHRTDPVAGTLILAEQTVKVYFNPDPQLVPIPGVVGLSLEEARLGLEADGFKVGEVTIEKTDSVAENTVISSDPPADTPALQGSNVNLTVAGPPDSVQVPGQVVGMAELEARSLLEGEPVLVRRHHRGPVEFDDPRGHRDRDQPGARRTGGEGIRRHDRRVDGAGTGDGGVGDRPDRGPGAQHG